MKRVAIVEDTPDNRMLLRALLEEEYLLDEYPDGPLALEGIPDTQPDLILMDISLPGMDGVEVLRRLRAKGLEVPAIALTAHAMAGDRERLLGEGFDAYVSKPIVEEDELFNAIERLLAKGAG